MTDTLISRSYNMSVLLLHDTDGERYCTLPITGLSPGERSIGVLHALVRVPVHVVSEVRSTTGRQLYGEREERNRSSTASTASTILEWRIVLLVVYGCGPTSTGQANCKRECH